MAVLSEGLLNQFAYTYVDGHRKELKRYTDVKVFSLGFREDLFSSFTQYAAQKGIKGTPSELATARLYINRQLKALVARQLWRDNGYYMVVNSYDKTVEKALEAIQKYNTLLN